MINTDKRQIAVRKIKVSSPVLKALRLGRNLYKKKKVTHRRHGEQKKGTASFWSGMATDGLTGCQSMVIGIWIEATVSTSCRKTAGKEEVNRTGRRTKDRARRGEARRLSAHVVVVVVSLDNSFLLFLSPARLLAYDASCLFAVRTQASNMFGSLVGEYVPIQFIRNQLEGLLRGNE